jgi:hypothetical protein
MKKVASSPALFIAGAAGEVDGRRRGSSVDHESSPSERGTQPLIVLDWDDTLFPTSWLKDIWKPKCNGKWHMTPLPMRKWYRAPISKVEQVALAVLESAKALGRVVLVTNSRRPWVDNSSNIFTPVLAQPLHEDPVVDVAYALECMGGMTYDTVKNMDDPQAVYSYEENYYTEGKAKTIASFVEEHFLGDETRNVLSLGDGVFERNATQRLRKPNLKARRADSIKTVKMMEDPSADQLCAQLQIILAALPGMVAHDFNFDISLEDPVQMEVQLRKFLNP